MFWNLAVAIRIDVSGHAIPVGAQHPIGHPVTVGIQQPVVSAPVAVEVHQWTAGVLGAVEPEPAQLPAPIGCDRPRPGPVVGEVRLRGAVVVEVEHGMIDDAIAVKVRERVVAHPVTVEIQADRIEPAVTVEV